MLLLYIINYGVILSFTLLLSLDYVTLKNYVKIQKLKIKIPYHYLWRNIFSSSITPGLQNMIHNVINTQTQIIPRLCKNRWTLSSHPLGIPVHYVQRCTNSLSQISLINNQNITLCDTRT